MCARIWRRVSPVGGKSIEREVGIALLSEAAALWFDALVQGWVQYRPEADNILKFAMLDFGIGKVTLNAIYDGVRLGGQSIWDENTLLKSKGERRVLKNFPEDPTTHWADWKKDKANFVN
jgi:hypothetical protein